MAKVKPKSTKWKSQARNTKMVKKSAIGPTNIKRPSNGVSWSSSEIKRKKVLSPLRQSPKYSQLSPSKQKLNHKLKGFLQVTRQLKLVDEE